MSGANLTQDTKSSELATSTLLYMSGFGNEFATEALPGALPVGQNNPQICPYGLYAEQLSGTAFTVPRAKNQRVWLYRVHPSVVHSPFSSYEQNNVVGVFDDSTSKVDPNQMRWFPKELMKGTSEGANPVDWLDGLYTLAGQGDSCSKTGLAIHMYSCNTSMGKKALYNSDGDFLIVPQIGTLHIKTEMGKLEVRPCEICVIPRGIRFHISVEGPSRGYVLEIFGGHFQLPDLGPIGSNGLANTRDFLHPVAAYEDTNEEWDIINKFGGKFFRALSLHSPFNVVAWHGNYAPYKYDLTKFNTMNSVSYDHPDPSIYTVLTCPTDTPGVALTDFVIFPPRWMVMEKSFRPPYFHRNCMTEFMGMVWGKYDAKVGFQPGGASLHSIMTPHGPDADTFIKASEADLKPEKFDAGLAFMFESTMFLRLTPLALEAPFRDVDYQECWQRLPRVFNPNTPVVKGPLVVADKPAGATEGGSGSAKGAVVLSNDGSSIQL